MDFMESKDVVGVIEQSLKIQFQEHREHNDKELRKLLRSELEEYGERWQQQLLGGLCDLLKGDPGDIPKLTVPEPTGPLCGGGGAGDGGGSTTATQHSSDISKLTVMRRVTSLDTVPECREPFPTDFPDEGHVPGTVPCPEGSAHPGSRMRKSFSADQGMTVDSPASMTRIRSRLRKSFSAEQGVTVDSPASMTRSGGRADFRLSFMQAAVELEEVPINANTARSSILKMDEAPIVDEQVPSESQEVCSTQGSSSSLRKCQHWLKAKVVEASLFEAFVVGVVVVNTIMIGIQTNWVVTNINEPEPYAFELIELCFTIIFMTELGLRIFVYGRTFLCMAEWRWNLFDCFIVMFQIAEIISAGVGGAPTGFGSSSAVRIIRVFRILRILRMVRLLRFIQELRAMVYSILSSFRGLGWTLALLFMIMYMVGIFFIQLIVESSEQRETNIMNTDEDLKYYFGTLERTIMSLYESMTGGLSWNEALRPLVDNLGMWVTIPYAIYVAFVCLAVTNVVTGMFVESARIAGEADRETEIKKHMRGLFKMADSDNNGELDFAEFELFLADPKCSKYFLDALRMDQNEALGLFLLLDTNDSGTVEYEEFVEGVLRLRGPARAIDLATLMYCNQRMIFWWQDRMGLLLDAVNKLHDGDHIAQKQVKTFASWNKVKARGAT